jgi:hypothetical protein
VDANPDKPNIEAIAADLQATFDAQANATIDEHAQRIEAASLTPADTLRILYAAVGHPDRANGNSPCTTCANKGHHWENLLGQPVWCEHCDLGRAMSLVCPIGDL